MFYFLSLYKQGRQHRKERVSKQKLLKGCHQGQNIIVLAILECLEFENFSSRPTMMADNTFQCSIAPPNFEIHFAGPDKADKFDMVIKKYFFTILCYDLYTFVYCCSFSCRMVNKMLDFCYEKVYENVTL